MKLFQQRELKEARAHAMEGGQALHVHTFNQGGHRLFKRYDEIAHLFDQDMERLRKTAWELGVRFVKVEKIGTESQHVDLCGKPFEKAKQRAYEGTEQGVLL